MGVRARGQSLSTTSRAASITTEVQRCQRSASCSRKRYNGRRCLEYVREIGHYDRSLGSSGYHASAEYVMSALGKMGLQARIVPWPMDDKPVPWNWNVPFAWEPHAAAFKVLSPEERTLVNFITTPTCLHPWSASTPPDGQAAEIVYVGAGVTDSDYEGKDVKGKIVFADRGANWLLYVHAIQKRGALGYISDDILAIPKVKTREQYPDMVLWYTFYEREFGTNGPIQGWGCSISPRMGDYLRGLLQRGPVKGHALVQARTFSGVMENVLGSIEGEDAGGEEFLCMAHLDHYRPGAMDNAAGCAALMEAGNAINTLIATGSLPRPRRSIRFLFGPEGHMSNVYPHSLGEAVTNIVGSWTADTVGAKPHVVGGPLLLARASAATPTFLDDIGTSVAEGVVHVVSRNRRGARARRPTGTVRCMPGRPPRSSSTRSGTESTATTRASPAGVYRRSGSFSGPASSGTRSTIRSTSSTWASWHAARGRPRPQAIKWRRPARKRP